MRLFLFFAVVLAVFAVIATCTTLGTLFGLAAVLWFYSSVLSYLVGALIGDQVVAAVRSAFSGGGKPAA